MLVCHASAVTFLLVIGLTWWNVIIVCSQVTNPAQVMRFNNCSCSPQRATCSAINNSSHSTTQSNSLVTTSFSCSCHQLADTYNCYNPQSTNVSETRVLTSENLTSFERCDTSNFIKCQTYLSLGLQLYIVPWTGQDYLSAYEYTHVFVCILIPKGCWDCTISGIDMCEIPTIPSRSTPHRLPSSTLSSLPGVSPSNPGSYSSTDNEGNNATAEVDVKHTTAEIGVKHTTAENDVKNTTAETDVKHTSRETDVDKTTVVTDINKRTAETGGGTTPVADFNKTTAETGGGTTPVADFNSTLTTASLLNANTTFLSPNTMPTFQTPRSTDDSAAFKTSSSSGFSNQTTPYGTEAPTSASTLTSAWPVMNPTANVTEVTSSSSSSSSSLWSSSSSSSYYTNPNTINLSESTHDSFSTCCPTSASDITSFPNTTGTAVQSNTEILNSTIASIPNNTKNPDTTIVLTSSNIQISEAANTNTTQYQAVSETASTENPHFTTDSQTEGTTARSSSPLQSDSVFENYTHLSTDFSTPSEIYLDNITTPIPSSAILYTGESANNKGDKQDGVDMKTIIIAVPIVGTTVLLALVVSLILLKRRRRVNSRMQLHTSTQLEVVEITKTTETHLMYFNQHRGISGDTKLITSF